MSDNVGGRPIIKIDLKLVQKLCEIQCTGEEISSVLGVSYDTLVRRIKELGQGGFSEYYKKNSQVGKASLRRLQWGSATKGNVPMQIWLGKQYLGQKDKTESDVTLEQKLSDFIFEVDDDDDGKE
jgi:predicted nucleic-acid-binding Zn-ribbon protein